MSGSRSWSGLGCKLVSARMYGVAQGQVQVKFRVRVGQYDGPCYGKDTIYRQSEVEGQNQIESGDCIIHDSVLRHDQHDKLSLSRVSPGQDKYDSHVNGQHQGHDEHKIMNVN